ncbi:hypothetical protein O181_051685 [Austropuccinia psidii MF-1]|uniref:Uncharacterized protein n=1 Tax=Austropuccinia psidii MF-1 TaxID=1389203 RepID=A0A9Q3E3H2_9BASI|nr:hypothetical protein [Austropuccinia psidii MF-1]
MFPKEYNVQERPDYDEGPKLASDGENAKKHEMANSAKNDGYGIHMPYRSPRGGTAKIINESLPTTSTPQNYFPLPKPHIKNPSSGSAEIPSFDGDYIPTSKFPSEFNIRALSDHQIKGEALEHLQQIISDTIIPSSCTGIPRKMGSPSHGSLKSAEWALLYKIYIQFLMLSPHISLDELNSPNMQRKIGKSDDLEN